MVHKSNVVLICLSLALLAGCSHPQHSEAFTDVMADWPSPTMDRARLVFFSLPPTTIIPQGEDDDRVVEVNISIASESHIGRFMLGAESAVYVDVPVGDYTIDVHLASLGLELSAEPQQVYFVRTQIRSDGFCDKPEFVDEQAATTTLREKKIKSSEPSFSLTLIPREGKPLATASFNLSEAPAAGRGRLVLVRSSGLAGIIMPVRVGVDGPPQMQIRNRQYGVIDVPSGKHIVTLSYSPNIIQGLADTYRLGLDVDVPAGDTSYIGFFNIDDLSRIVPLTKSQADDSMQKCTLAKKGVLQMEP